MTIWIPVNNATWTSTSTATWSAPTATGATSTNGGVTYYAYESTLQTTPTLSGTTGVLPNLTFTMPATASPGTYYVQVDAAIKTTKPTDPAYIPWTQNLTTTKLGPVNIIIN